MREIKFKARFQDEWIYWESGDKSNWFWEKVREFDLDPFQYTGLKDKNGKEIYEGDIIKWKDNDNTYNIFIVKYEIEWCGFTIESIQNSGQYMLNGDHCRHYNSEVIGNKFENPDLLK